MLGVVVHAVDVATHPIQGPGFRWAVHMGNNWRDPSSILNAGQCLSRQDAEIIGELAAVVGAKVAFALTGEHWYQHAVFLDYDPTPPEAIDRTPLFSFM